MHVPCKAGAVLRRILLISPQFSSLLLKKRREFSSILLCCYLFFSSFLLFLLMENPENIAVCLSCGNEWEVRDPSAKKKRKCPVCGKYRVTWKSEMPNNTAGSEKSPPDPASEKENSPAISPELEENTPAGEENSPGEKEKSGRKKEKSRRYKENSPPEKTGEKGEENSAGGSGWLLVAALIVLGVLACSFLAHAPSHQSHLKQTAQRDGIRKASIYG